MSRMMAGEKKEILTNFSKEMGRHLDKKVREAYGKNASCYQIGPAIASRIRSSATKRSPKM